MEMYLLKSAACLAVLLLFYKLLLENENMHVFKRFYLLASTIAAIVIPLITFTTYVEPSSTMLQPVLNPWEANSEVAIHNFWPYVLLGVYVLGTLFFGIKFIKNLSNLIVKIKRNEKIRENDITNVLLSEKTPPHTFFHYIFFNKQKYLRNEIHQNVKVHEEAHARQMHSLDVIFIELLQIFLWFNPLIFFLKNAVKLNHEFLADRAVIRQGYNTADYQQTLLSFSSGDLQSDLVNPINYSSIKKRFTVMKTQTSKKVFWVRSMLLLPLIAGLLYGFSTKEVVEKDITSNTLLTQNSKVLEINVDKAGSIFINNTKLNGGELKKLDIENYESYSINASPDAPEEIIKQLVQFGASKKLRGIVSVCNVAELQSDEEIKSENEREISKQEKATPQMIAEYNKLAKHYREQQITEAIVQEKGFKRMMYIFGIMTEAQRKNAEKLPPPPPPARIARDIPPPPAPPVENVGDTPPPPPPPPSPVEAVQGWIEEGAAFFYNGKPISGKEALEVVQKNNGKNLSVKVEERNSKKTVRLSDK